MPPPNAADGYALALEEARRTLDEQERAVAELRSRAATLISAATIATSFLGAPFIHDGHLGPASAVALGAFVLLSFATIALLLQRWEFEFSLGARTILTSYVEPIAVRPVEPARIHRDLAIHMDASSNANRHRIVSMTTIFHIGCVLLTTEILAWVVAIVLDA